MLRAGADECVERRVTDEEFNARLRSARRIAELEAALRVTLTENRKLRATDDLTHVPASSLGRGATRLRLISAACATDT
jgi:PleD family two-component response regulator